MTRLPGGTVTFLLTDVEGSTMAWEGDEAGMRRAVAQLDATVAQVVVRHHGVLVKPRGEGDSHFCVFERASDALRAALDVQRSSSPLSVRMALHTGEAERRGGDYYGRVVNRAARLRAVGHGGQTLISGASAAVIGSALPDGASLRDLGEHRLRDLEQPEHVWQLCHADLADDFPPLRSLNTARHNLPIQLTSLVGRDEDVARVRSLVGAGQRIVTLIGPGGAGKTRLALQVASEVTDEFGDGVWLVPLAGLSRGDAIADGVASAVGAPPSATDVVRWLGDKHLAIVLDNCEHVVEEAAKFVARLVSTCPTVTVLATSRQPLRTGGEVTYQVPTLARPPLDESVDVATLSTYAAVQLFVERARAARPSFEVTTRNAAAVAAVCSRLDGIPLALELGAARLRFLSVEQLHERLAQVFTVLTGGDRTTLPHHQTLRATLDWSRTLVRPDEELVWRRLAVFRGTFDLEAAESVTGFGLEPGHVLEALTALADHSLVEVVESEDTIRYRLIEVVAQYCAELLHEANETDVVRVTHAQWALNWAETHLAERALAYSYGESPTWAAEIQRAHDDLIAALEWHRDRDEASFASAVLIANPLLFFGGRLREGLDWLESALSRGEPPGAETHIALLSRKVVTAFELSRFEEGLAAAEAGLALDPTDDQTRFELHNGAGICLWRLDRFDEAETQLRAALEVALERGNHAGAALIHNNLGLIAGTRGDLVAAREEFEAGLRIEREHLDRTPLNLKRLAEVAFMDGRDAEGWRYSQERLAIARARGDDATIAEALLEMTWRRLTEEDRPDVASELGELWERLGAVANTLAWPYAAARLVAATAVVSLRIDDLGRFRQMVDLTERAEAAGASYATWVWRWLAREGVDQPARAAVVLPIAERAALTRSNGDPVQLAEGHLVLGEVALALGDLALAERALSDADMATRAVADSRAAAGRAMPRRSLTTGVAIRTAELRAAQGRWGEVQPLIEAAPEPPAGQKRYRELAERLRAEAAAALGDAS